MQTVNKLKITFSRRFFIGALVYLITHAAFFGIGLAMVYGLINSWSGQTNFNNALGITTCLIVMVWIKELADYFEDSLYEDKPQNTAKNNNQNSD